MRTNQNGEKNRSWNERFFNFMAPVFGEGTVIAFSGEDGCVWRYKYVRGECMEQYLNVYEDRGWE